MPKTKKDTKQEAAIEKATNVTPGKTVIDKNSGRAIVNWDLVEPAVKEKMMTITSGLREAFASVRVGFLKIGSLLSEAEMIMKPRGLWVNYLNSFPNFKQAQAYRYINGYMIAQKNYPPAVLDVVLSTGMDLIGTKDRPFGKYQDVVKQLPPPKDDDSGKALAWCNRVEAAYKESRKKENKVVNSKDLQKQAFLSVMRAYGKVPEKQQLQWVRGLFSYVLGNLGIKQMEEITPQNPPAEFIKKVGEAENASEESE